MRVFALRPTTRLPGACTGPAALPQRTGFGGRTRWCSSNVGIRVVAACLPDRSPAIWEMFGWHPSAQRLVALLVGRQPVQVIAVAVNPRKFRTPPDTIQLSTPSTR